MSARHRPPPWSVPSDSCGPWVSTSSACEAHACGVQLSYRWRAQPHGARRPLQQTWAPGWPASEPAARRAAMLIMELVLECSSRGLLLGGVVCCDAPHGAVARPGLVLEMLAGSACCGAHHGAAARVLIDGPSLCQAVRQPRSGLVLEMLSGAVCCEAFHGAAARAPIDGAAAHRGVL